MISYKKGKCPKCGNYGELMFSNNPLSGETICFDCIKNNLNYQNIEHANFFCRTYNLPFKPELWLKLVEDYKEEVFKEYTSIVLQEQADHINLYYSSSTADVWNKANKEWERVRSLAEILQRIEPIKEGYLVRGRLKWGEQYTFEEIIKLDSIYSKTIKANNIIDPMQKEAIKTLCKLQIQIDEAIRSGDAKAIKDYASSYSVYAKQANLDGMIANSKTDDITTVAELYKYMEDSGFKFKYFDGAAKDEVDTAIEDIQNANRKLILESTGLQSLLEEMIQQNIKTQEQEYTQKIVEDENLKKILEFTPEDGEIEVESDDAAVNFDFNEIDPDTPVTANNLATKVVFHKED